MSRPTKPYLWRDPKTGNAHIGAKYTDDIKMGDDAPAEVWHDGPWLHIQTCPYEGSVMLHFNTVPLLIKELRRLERADKTKRDGRGSEPASA